ncbi:MAG: radical SAM protein, partial [Elusimicrobiota bacterium]
IKQLKRDYDVQSLYFVEDNFFADNERVVKISELMIREGLNNIIWGGSSRVESVNLEVLKIAKMAGCRSVTIGYESGSQRILDILRKEYTVETSKKSVEIIKQAGLIPHGNVILGNPTETMEDVELTKRFVIETGIVLPEVYIYTPYPGTLSWDILKEQGLIPSKINWEKFTQERVISNVSKIPTEKVESLRAEMLLSSYLRQKRYALRLILDTIKYQPIAVFEKVFITFVPVILRSLKKLFKLIPLKNVL